MKPRLPRMRSAVILAVFILLLSPPLFSSESELSIYNDSFDTLGMDFWETAQYTFNEAQLKNFRLGDKDIIAGRLVITTKPGGFSKAGLGTRYKLRGNFDVQIDCGIDFDSSIKGMDQVANFVIGTRGEDFAASEWGVIRLEKQAKKRLPRLIFIHSKAMKAKVYDWREIETFEGSLRLVREGPKLTGFYRRAGTSQWRALGSASRFPAGDATLGIVVQNFTSRRKKIKANKRVTVTFDNYRINHADEVVEDEI